MAPENLQAAQQDVLVKQQRLSLFPQIRPFTADVVNADTTLQVALAELQPNQKEVLFDVIADYAGVVKYGRIQKEEIRYTKDTAGNNKVVDPVMNRYVAKFRSARVLDIDGYLGIVEKTSRVVLNSFQQEFGFIKTQ